MLKIPFSLEKSVKDAIKQRFGFDDAQIAAIAECAKEGEENADIEVCVKNLLPKSMDSKMKQEVWDFLFHFVIVG